MNGLKKILKTILPGPLKTSYYIGFIDKCNLQLSRDERYKKVIWIENPKHSWFADPFIYKNTQNHLEVFVEEMDNSEKMEGGGNFKITY